MMLTESDLFSALPSNSCLHYSLVRGASEKHLADAREHCEDLWRTFKPHADEHFLSEFPLRFHERWFEMYLAVSLIRCGFAIQSRNSGPDVLLTSCQPRIWVEAVCATSGQPGAPDSVPEAVDGKSMAVPVDQYVLRIRSSLQDKARRFSEYIEDGMIRPDDILLVAVNVASAGLSSLDMVECMPRALYGIGNPILEYNKRTGEQVGSHRETISEIRKKSSGAPVGIQPFVDRSMPHISATLASSAKVVSLPSRLGDDCVLYPNLASTNSWPKGAIPLGEEWSYDEVEDGWRGTKTTYFSTGVDER